jgi:hypothetical protein
MPEAPIVEEPAAKRLKAAMAQVEEGLAIERLEKELAAGALDLAARKLLVTSESLYVAKYVVMDAAHNTLVEHRRNTVRRREEAAKEISRVTSFMNEAREELAALEAKTTQQIKTLAETMRIDDIAIVDADDKLAKRDADFQVGATDEEHADQPIFRFAKVELKMGSVMDRNHKDVFTARQLSRMVYHSQGYSVEDRKRFAIQQAQKLTDQVIDYGIILPGGH